jgi:hypothetical protein
MGVHFGSSSALTFLICLIADGVLSARETLKTLSSLGNLQTNQSLLGALNLILSLRAISKPLAPS